MTDVKIKCDDCKFVEDCVDYGWQECKKFTPAPSTPMTNEEWFCGLSTEEKVKALLNLHEKVRQRMRTDIGGENSFYKGDYYREWLKQPHTPIS